MLFGLTNNDMDEYDSELMVEQKYPTIDCALLDVSLKMVHLRIKQLL